MMSLVDLGCTAAGCDVVMTIPITVDDGNE
jgi:hypothetical protein